MKYLFFFSLLGLLTLLFVSSCKTTADATDGEVILLYVSSDVIADCGPDQPKNCYLVRESLNDDFYLYHGDIEGFTHEDGYEYELKVKKFAQKSSASNQASKYVLVEQINRVSTTEVDLRLHDIWVVTTLAGQPLKPASPRPRLELNPTEGKLMGNGSCNEIFGTFAAAGTAIKFSRIGSTKKFCADVMQQEQQFIQALQEVDRYVVRDLQLIFMKGDQTHIICQKVD